MAYREAIGAGEPLGGQLYPRRRTSDFKDKLSPNRFFEFGAVTPAPVPMSVGHQAFADPWPRNKLTLPTPTSRPRAR